MRTSDNPVQAKFRQGLLPAAQPYSKLQGGTGILCANSHQSHKVFPSFENHSLVRYAALTRERESKSKGVMDEVSYIAFLGTDNYSAGRAKGYG
jgi:hypothetical protein